MGSETLPNDADRRTRRELAEQIIEAVRNDEEFPLDPFLRRLMVPLDRVDRIDSYRDLHLIIFGLAQEIQFLRSDLWEACALATIPDPKTDGPAWQRLRDIGKRYQIQDREP